MKEKTAMKRRKWDSKAKAMIVLEGLKGKPVAEVCAEHQISQAQYYQWRDHFISNMPQVFTNVEKKDKQLTLENIRLRRMIGDLTIELKKTEEWLK